MVQGRKVSGWGHWGYSTKGSPQPGVTQDKRACVGVPVGEYQVGGQDNGYLVTVYAEIVWQKAQSPRAIDIFLDNTWYQRVHW